MKSARLSAGWRPTKNASSSSNSSGCAAIRLRTPKKTNSAKSTTAASLTPTSVSPPAFPAGRPIAAASTFSTDRADEVEEHPSGGTYDRPIEEGGGTTSTFPFEKWRYRYIEGIGNDVNIEFVDTTMTGEYHMTMDPSEKDALTNVPGAGLTMYEQMGLACKADRFTRTDGTRLGTGNQPMPASMNQFERLDQFTKLQQAPGVKYKDLEALVSSNIKYNLLPMKVRADFIPVTESNVLTNVTIQFDRKDLQFKQKEGLSQATVNIYARITTMSRRPVNWFEEAVTVDIPTELLQQAVKGSSIYQKSIPLAPGRYRLNVVGQGCGGRQHHQLRTGLGRASPG